MATHQSLTILAELRSQVGLSIPGWVAADESHTADVEAQPTNSLGIEVLRQGMREIKYIPVRVT